MLGGADLLVNNAGTLGASPLPALADYPLAELRAAFEVNVVAPVALTQALLPWLRRRGGAVLNITSDAAVGRVRGLGRIRRGQGRAGAGRRTCWPPRRPDVRVWWVDPGRPAHCACTRQAFPGEDISDRPLPETVVPGFARLIGERMPSGRYRAADLMPAVPLGGDRP